MLQVKLRDATLAYPSLDGNLSSIKRLLLGFGQLGYDRNVRPALRGVSLDVGRGDRVGIFGHNGSGKSTLLRLIAGVYPVTSGVVDVIGRCTPLLGFGVGSNYDLTANDNIRVLLQLDGKSPSAEMIDRVWEFTELPEALRQRPLRTFSSGMTMRVLFSAATIEPNDILLVDEWLSVFDASFSRKAEQRMRDLIDSSGIVMIASHDIELLKRICNRFVHLNAGQIESDGCEANCLIAR